MFRATHFKVPTTTSWLSSFLLKPDMMHLPALACALTSLMVSQSSQSPCSHGAHPRPKGYLRAGSTWPYAKALERLAHTEPSGTSPKKIKKITIARGADTQVPRHSFPATTCRDKLKHFPQFLTGTKLKSMLLPIMLVHLPALKTFQDSLAAVAPGSCRFTVLKCFGDAGEHLHLSMQRFSMQASHGILEISDVSLQPVDGQLPGVDPISNRLHYELRSFLTLRHGF